MYCLNSLCLSIQHNGQLLSMHGPCSCRCHLPVVWQMAGAMNVMLSMQTPTSCGMDSLQGTSTSLCMLSITNLTKPRQEAVFDCRGVVAHALPAVNQPNALCVHIMFTSHEKYLYCIVGAVHVRMASCTASSDWSVGWHYLIHLSK